MFGVNLAALKTVWETGDSEFITFASIVVERAYEQQAELRKKGWFGGC